MTKKSNLEALRKKRALDEIESKISKELSPADSNISNEGYLTYYDASLINKGLVQTQEKESDGHE